VAVEGVRWDKCSTQLADDNTFLYGNRDANHHLGTGSFTHKEIISAVESVESISDRMSYITLRGR